VHSDGLDDVLFLVHQDGAASVCQDQRPRHLAPGDGTLHVATCPYELNFPTSARVIVLQAPKRLIPPGELLPPARPNTAFTGNTPAMRVFSAFARELLSVSDGLSDRTREEMGGTAIDLLVSVLGGAEDPSRLGQDALLRTMESFVRANLHDPDLTAESVARQHHVSLRYTQALFSSAGISPAAYIRTERLNRALQALRDPRLAGVSVAAIGHRCGFAGVDTFIRAFRREFGMTPGEWRSCRADGQAGGGPP
jgi:AraC-like DNA-binding protein